MTDTFNFMTTKEQAEKQAREFLASCSGTKTLAELTNLILRASQVEELVNRLEITNAAWVNDLGCYPLPYGTKRHIHDILMANESAINAAKK